MNQCTLPQNMVNQAPKYDNQVKRQPTFKNQVISPKTKIIRPDKRKKPKYF